MSFRFELERLWSTLRYGPLLAPCRHSRRWAGVYAAVVGTVEYYSDSKRRQVAVRRIERCLGCPAERAARIYRDSLVSEAREEADTAYVMEDAARLEKIFAPAEPAPDHRGPVLYMTCHLGSPILAFLYLRRRSIDVRMILRELDGANPVAAAKRRFGEKKTACGAALAGTAFLGTDTQSLFAARADLLAGKSILAAVDVPGDVVTRRRTLRVFDSEIVVAGGVLTLAAMTGAAIQPVFAVSDRRGLRLVYGSRIQAAEEEDLARRVAREIRSAVGRFPGEWWLWPYLVEAT